MSEVKITDVALPFGSIMMLMLKVAIATIPVALFLTLIVVSFGMYLAFLLPILF